VTQTTKVKNDGEQEVVMLNVNQYLDDEAIQLVIALQHHQLLV
jgi:hypothetical protein